MKTILTFTSLGVAMLAIAWQTNPTTIPIPARNLDVPPRDAMAELMAPTNQLGTNSHLPIPLESVKAKTNDLCVYTVDGKTVLRVDYRNQVWIRGEPVGLISSNGFTPVPQLPNFDTGLQYGAIAAWRNQDVRDIRLIIPIGQRLWSAENRASGK